MSLSHEVLILQQRVTYLEALVVRLKTGPMCSRSHEGLVEFAEFLITVGKEEDSHLHESAGLALKSTANRLKVYME